MSQLKSILPYQISNDIRALIFDFDGTLVDSMPANLASWQESFASFGHRFDEAFFYRHAGVSLVGVVKLYNDAHGSTLDPEAVADLKTRLHVKYVPQTRLIEPVIDVVRRHHGKVPMAVASGNARTGVEAVMETLRISHFFDAVVCGEDVPLPKPAPDCFLTAARLIGVSPTSCEVFEDAAPGIEGARRAGMKATDIRQWLSGKQ
jgi:HAD superfamily hydrolase (TIGR01509 family)